MSAPSVLPVVIGVDIGGTHTDVVLVDRRRGLPKVIAEVKELTTNDITSGVQKAVLKCLASAQDKGHVLSPLQVNIGTTHFVNAVVRGRELVKVAVIRLCGPVSEELPPYCDFPSRLHNLIGDSVYLVHGGLRIDGSELDPLDENELKTVTREIRDRGIKNIVVLGIFSPIRVDQEKKAEEIILGEFPEASVSLSNEIGDVGLIERENSTILNECLKPLCRRTVGGFKSALEEIGVMCPFYFTQNDGTITSSDDVLRCPIFTFASGPTNSMRGAAFLTDLKEAIVVDIGGTTTDVGVLKNGFAREASTRVKVGGVRTNFRMPDVISIGLGGGSYVKEQRTDKEETIKVTVGPLSAGLNLKKEAFVYCDDKENRRLTATDVAVSAGLCDLGSKANVEGLDKTLVGQAVHEIHRMVEELVDLIKLSRDELPILVVGGGSILIDQSRKLRGTSKLIVPKHFGVANAIGAALCKVAVSVGTVINLGTLIDTAEMKRNVEEAVSDVTDDPDGKKKEVAILNARKPFLSNARDIAIEGIVKKAKSNAVDVGADEESLEVLDKQDSVLSYIPGDVIEIKVKVVGDLKRWDTDKDQAKQWQRPTDCEEILAKESAEAEKQSFSVTGKRIDKESDDDEDDFDAKKHPQEPTIDPKTGEWILSPWDIECLIVGVGIYGCGGGASPHMGRLRSLRAMKEGKRLRVISAERLFKSPGSENKMVLVSAFIGAPLCMYEQGVSSSETTVAAQCLKDLYEIGNYKDGDLQNKDGVSIETKTSGIRFIHDYQPSSKETGTDNSVVALMSAEIGGLNAMEPILVAANMDLPVVDADGMSRAFPEVQMFIPYMYGTPPHPVAIVGSGNVKERSVVLYSPGNKLLENCLRDVSIAHGCSAGMAIPLSKSDTLNKSCLKSVSSSWRLGNSVLRARLQKESVIEAIVEQEYAKHVATGKITDVQRETSGGFNRGQVIIEGVDEWVGMEIMIQFQNENLVIIPLKDGKRETCIGSTPDLISIVDADTAEPVPTEEVRYGMRVAVLLMPSFDMLRRPEALKWVGPRAFQYAEDFKPYKQRRETVPIPPC